MTTRATATSWTGSERLRRTQGLCLPPARQPVAVPRFLVPASVRCAVHRLFPATSWLAHTTIRDTGFERFESYGDGLYTFRLGAWLIRVGRSHVRHREDSYRPQAGSEKAG